MMIAFKSCRFAFALLAGFAVPVHFFAFLCGSCPCLSSELLCLPVPNPAKVPVFRIGVLCPC